MCDDQRERSLLSDLYWIAAVLFLIVMEMVALVYLVCPPLGR